MNLLKNKRSSKIISLLAISIGAFVIVLSFVSGRVFLEINSNPKNSNIGIIKTPSAEEKKADSIINEAIKTQLERYPTDKEEEFAISDLGSSQNHWKDLGIENAKISGTEEKNLYLMTIKLIKAQSEYYSTKKEESLEKVKDLYLPKAFEQFKKDIKDESGQLGSQFYNKIEKIKFSKPRSYKDLPGRIGIITHIEFIDHYTNNYTPLFIFKNVNGEWKIEKQSEVVVRLAEEEDWLIKEIKDGK